MLVQGRATGGHAPVKCSQPSGCSQSEFLSNPDLVCATKKTCLARPDRNRELFARRNEHEAVHRIKERPLFLQIVELVQPGIGLFHGETRILHELMNEAR